MVGSCCYRGCMVPPPAPGEEESAALALVNSLYWARGRMVDDIGDPGSFTGWVGRRCGVHLDLGFDGVAKVRELRGAIRTLFEAVIAGRPLPNETVDALNEVTVAAPGAMVLRSNLTAEWQFVGGSPGDRLLATFARDAIGLSVGKRAGDLIACQAPNCVRLLLRDHNRRQWCGSRCGDRVRAARYHARLRREQEV
jgi:hypothetical protein